jgi:hypothetical protein
VTAGSRAPRVSASGARVRVLVLGRNQAETAHEALLFFSIFALISFLHFQVKFEFIYIYIIYIFYIPSLFLISKL